MKTTDTTTPEWILAAAHEIDYKCIVDVQKGDYTKHLQFSTINFRCYFPGRDHILKYTGHSDGWKTYHLLYHGYKIGDVKTKVFHE